VKDARILIAGGGPVGLTAALELSRRGFAPRIIDRDEAPSPESRALAINPRTLDLLEPSGIAETLLARSHRVNGLMIRYRGRTLAEVNIANLRHRFNFLTVLAQSDTERILIDALAARGIAMGWNTELTSLAFDDGHPVCNGERCDILIGADGARSFVRKSLGLAFDGESEPQTFGLADVHLADWPHPWDRAVATIRDGFVVAFIPMREGYGRFVSSRPGTMALLPPEAKPGKVDWEAEFRISYRQTETYQSGNVFLAGDAAHIHSPVGGRGMNLGIEDACWLAWLIAEGRAAEYTALRHGPGASVLKQTHQFTRLVAARGPMTAFMRRYVLPFALGFDVVQRAFFPRLAGLDTPKAPWLT
jgi:2-polyprenyl-6-methoxyphenol hydroxylase-like FAD-dependent oxidoreductase